MSSYLQTNANNSTAQQVLRCIIKDDLEGLKALDHARSASILASYTITAILHGNKAIMLYFVDILAEERLDVPSNFFERLVKNAGHFLPRSYECVAMICSIWGLCVGRNMDITSVVMLRVDDINSRLIEANLNVDPVALLAGRDEEFIRSIYFDWTSYWISRLSYDDSQASPREHFGEDLIWLVKNTDLVRTPILAVCRYCAEIGQVLEILGDCETPSRDHYSAVIESCFDEYTGEPIPARLARLASNVTALRRAGYPVFDVYTLY